MMRFLVGFLVSGLLVTMPLGEDIFLRVDDSPVTGAVGRDLRLNCTIPGYGITVYPMFARWERRHTHCEKFRTVTRDRAILPGSERLSIDFIPGGYTFWYHLTINSFRPEDRGAYRCVVSGPTKDTDLACGTVQVVT